MDGHSQFQPLLLVAFSIKNSQGHQEMWEAGFVFSPPPVNIVNSDISGCSSLVLSGNSEQEAAGEEIPWDWM